MSTGKKIRIWTLLAIVLAAGVFVYFRFCLEDL